jgi:hypothetical protein
VAKQSAMHQTRAVALSELLHCDPPAPDQWSLACACGHRARYQELRCRSILTAVGPVEMVRPYNSCSHCHHGQFPFGGELDVESKDLFPGVRRMLAVVGCFHFPQSCCRSRV